MSIGPTIRASHILVPTLEQAQQIQQQITEGAEFSLLAQSHSTCPSGKAGGDLGVFSRGQMVKPFEDAAYNASIGSVTDPVQTQFGYHLIQRTA